MKSSDLFSKYYVLCFYKFFHPRCKSNKSWLFAAGLTFIRMSIDKKRNKIALIAFYRNSARPAFLGHSHYLFIFNLTNHQVLRAYQDFPRETCRSRQFSLRHGSVGLPLKLSYFHRESRYLAEGLTSVFVEKFTVKFESFLWYKRADVYVHSSTLALATVVWFSISTFRSVTFAVGARRREGHVLFLTTL